MATECSDVRICFGHERSMHDLYLRSIVIYDKRTGRGNFNTIAKALDALYLLRRTKIIGAFEDTTRKIKERRQG